ncbi:MAG: phosphoglucosamine mutase [Bacteroidales bacterium]|jgi:phosphomannomutase|nr:phosphoglucosamine mutase [Bacteroidales bacterium]
MTLIKSISGIRGTIGGNAKTNLTPVDIVKFTAAFVILIKEREQKERLTIVTGRDARISGSMVSQLVCGTLQAMGCNVIDIGLTTTPTIEMAIPKLHASAGIMLTASHNPMEWNALKLLNKHGEFINDIEGKRIIELSENENIRFADVMQLGNYATYEKAIDDHIAAILKLSLVSHADIAKSNFSVAIDCVNSTGGIAIPKLLKALGVNTVYELYCNPNGIFPHNPEPLAEHLTDISQLMKEKKADVGFVVDPDVDRLAIVNSDGSMFGEEYTLVAISDYILRHTPGNAVSNISSTRALRDITERLGGKYFASAVGEVNVVEMMKQTNAIIGGEGNGGVIYPELHYGRDALVGIALFLSYLAKEKKSSIELKKQYPQYFISKNKIKIEENVNVDSILKKMQKKYAALPHSTIDGLKIEFDKEWAHLRKSNTEPIIRIYAESDDAEKADALASQIMSEIEEIAKSND